MWRHDNGHPRDYIVGNKKVIQYFVKPFDTKLATSQLRDRTIVGKQWVSKDILEKTNHTYQEYGEGSYAFVGKLKPVSLLADCTSPIT